jgi:uncharacterized membrane protein
MVSWFNNLIPTIFFFPFLFFIEFKFSLQFFQSVAISGIINVVYVILYHKSISYGDVSSVIPLMSFTPLFLLLTSPLIVGEFPSYIGVFGIILIVIGSFYLNSNGFKDGILIPLKTLVKTKSSRYMLIVAFILSISASYDKIGIESSSVFQYAFFINLFITSVITVILFFDKTTKIQDIKLERKNLLLVGIFTWLAFIFHMSALSLTLVAYVVAIKRTNGIVSVIFGHYFLGEPNIKDRMLGSVIMLIGVLLIILI